MDVRLADKQSMAAGFAAARFFLVANEMHIVVKGEVPCGLPIPETFYALKSAGPSDSDWDVCPTCHFAFVPTVFRTVPLKWPPEEGI